MKQMENKDLLILEYAKLATQKDSHETISRMSEIIDKLQMTDARIMEEATRLAVATFK